jgi:hypothetical protein
MLRKMLIGLATVAAIGIAAVPMDASARGGGGHGGGGGFHGGGGGGFHGGGASFRGGGAGFHEVWPRAADLAADLVQLGLLPCPAEQASAESLVEASTIVTTSGTSPFLG